MDTQVPLQQLVDDFARYLYLPRMRDPAVVAGAVREGLGLITWMKDSFAFADAYDEAAGRYQGLRGGRNVPIPETDFPGLLVQSEVAKSQLDKEAIPEPTAGRLTTSAPPAGDPAAPNGGTAGGAVQATTAPAEQPKPRRFHGSVVLDAARVGRDASRIADEVISHLAGLVGAKVRVTLEVEAEVGNGVPDNVVRTVTENSRTLKFTDHGFETS